MAFRHAGTMNEETQTEEPDDKMQQKDKNEGLFNLSTVYSGSVLLFISKNGIVKSLVVLSGLLHV